MSAHLCYNDAKKPSLSVGSLAKQPYCAGCVVRGDAIVRAQQFPVLVDGQTLQARLCRNKMVVPSLAHDSLCKLAMLESSGHLAVGLVATRWRALVGRACIAGTTSAVQVVQ